MDSSENGILVIEDEADLRALILHILEKDGYVACGAATGEEGLRLLKERRPALVLLDLMLPGMDGMAVCRRIRKDPLSGGVPILMLTARTDDEDVVAGLEAGADDYVGKPFSNRVLMARVHSLLRRGGVAGGSLAGDGDAGEGPALSVGAVVLSPERREVTAGGDRVDLTAGEFKTLQVMLRRPGVVFSRAQLLDLVRGSLHAVTDRAVDVQVAGLRKKLGRHAGVIETVRGAGYRVNPDA